MDSRPSIGAMFTMSFIIVSSPNTLRVSVMCVASKGVESPSIASRSCVVPSRSGVSVVGAPTHWAASGYITNACSDATADFSLSRSSRAACWMSSVLPLPIAICSTGNPVFSASFPAR